MKINVFVVLLIFLICESSTIKVFQNLVRGCDGKDLVKCIQIKTLKMIDRARSLKSVRIWEGVSLIRNAKDFREFTEASISDLPTKLKKLSSEQLSSLLWNSTKNFFDNHSLEIEEGRGKHKKIKWPLIVAFAIKTMMMIISYKAITAMSGAALIIGKIALILSAIWGLKKLVGGGGEKTTYEIVKTPHYSHTSHTSSIEDHGTYENYHRSLRHPNTEDNSMMERIYRGQKPGQK